MNLRSLTIGLAGAVLILVALAAGCGDDDNGSGGAVNTGTAVIGDLTYDFDVTLCSVTSEDSFTINGRGTTSDDKPILVNIGRTQNGDTFVIIGVNQASLLAQAERQFNMIVLPGNVTTEVGPAVFTLHVSGSVIEVQHERLPEFPAEIDLTCQV